MARRSQPGPDPRLVDSRNRVALSRAVRETLQVGPGDYVQWVLEAGGGRSSREAHHQAGGPMKPKQGKCPRCGGDPRPALPRTFQLPAAMTPPGFTSARLLCDEPFHNEPEGDAQP